MLFKNNLRSIFYSYGLILFKKLLTYLHFACFFNKSLNNLFNTNLCFLLHLFLLDVFILYLIRFSFLFFYFIISFLPKFFTLNFFFERLLKSESWVADKWYLHLNFSKEIHTDFVWPFNIHQLHSLNVIKWEDLLVEPLQNEETHQILLGDIIIMITIKHLKNKSNHLFS